MTAITRDLILDDAARLQVEPAVVMAFAEVESNGSGYLADGRPTILYEAHIFSAKTGGHWDASHPNISSPSWDRSLYKGGAKEYDRLTEASALNVDVAYQSISVGAFQIMGFNYLAAGYISPMAFYAGMKVSLDNQIAAFTSFCQHDSRLLDAMRRKDWETCARIYNGPGAVATYSAKLDAAYKVYAKKDLEYSNVIPLPGTPLAEPSFEGPPIPTTDASTPPPAGFTQQPSGNLVRDDVKTSPIVKGANAGQVITGVAGAAGTMGTVAMTWKSLLSGVTMSDMGIIVFGVVSVVAMILVFLYFGVIKKSRINMHRDGIA